MNNNNGRELLPWSQEIWDRIDRAVQGECDRTEVASRFLPPIGPLGYVTTVQADTVTVNGSANGNGSGNQSNLTVNETAVTPLFELSVEFSLTPQQVEHEAEWMTAVTLGTRAANLLSQAKDTALIGGDKGLKADPLFENNLVNLESGSAGTGLINIQLNEQQQKTQIIEVPPADDADPENVRWGENTFEAVAKAYSSLQSGEGLNAAHNGPFACVLHHRQYADAWAPTGTLTTPADRIKPLVTQGFYGTGNIPELTGFVVSVGGNTMDLVRGTDAITAVQQQDRSGRWLLRVYGRWTLRFKDTSAIRILTFLEAE
jgi:uncharacterized linocin/CFP29 family protein